MTKKKKLSAKEQKKQRQAQMTQLRQEQGWEAPDVSTYPKRQWEESDAKRSTTPFDETAVQDILPILAGGNPRKIKKNLIKAVEDSGKWASEPEFTHILFPPTKVMSHFLATLHAKGLSDVNPHELSGGEFEEFSYDAIVEAITELLTENMVEDIIEALDQIHQRLKAEGKGQEAAQVALIKLNFIHENKAELSGMPLLQALYIRSYSAASDLMELTNIINSTARDGMPLNKLLETALANPEISDRLADIFEQNPGLQQTIMDDWDVEWQRGLQAVYEGELNLELFTEEELSAVTTKVKEIEEKGDWSSDAGGTGEDEFLAWTQTYYYQIFTPERMDQMAEHLKTSLLEGDIPLEFVPFVQGLLNALQADNTLNLLESAFFPLLIGDLFSWMRSMQNESEEDDDDVEESNI